MAYLGAISQSSIYDLQSAQSTLQTSLTQQSSGKRLTSPAIDPAAYAIATSLATQAAAYNASTENVQNAFNAGNIASSATQQVSGIVSQLQNLAVEGADSFLSSTDRAALQAQANQLVAQANSISQTTNFNGVQLLNGSVAGPQAGTAATATVTNNDALAQGGNVVTQVAAANANFQNANGAAQGFGGNATTDSTIQVQIVNNNGTAQAVASVYDNATGKTVQSGAVGAGGTISGFENVNIKIGNISLADVGQSSTIQIAQAVPANTQNNALTVQSGANEGGTTNLAIPGVSSSSLQISNIDLSSVASSENAIGQLQNAQYSLSGALSNLGAQQNSLQYQIGNNQVNALNLTASQSSLSDLNYGQSVTNSTLAQIQSQIALALQAQNNHSAQAVLTLFPA